MSERRDGFSLGKECDKIRILITNMMRIFEAVFSIYHITSTIH